MNNLHPAIIESTKNLHPAGLRVVLRETKDPQAPPHGTLGTVTHVDDIGTVHVKWDTGSTLGLVPGEDKWTVLKEGN